MAVDNNSNQQDLDYTSLRDFKYKTLTGTTSSSANTSLKFRHGMSQVPSFTVVQEGNIYVARNGVDQNNIDIRSANTSESFKIILFY